MILAIDVKYNEFENTAKAVGVLFNWLDGKPAKIIEVVVHDIQEYIPGQFYKRELPCIKEVVEQVDINIIEAIVVDGHVYINNKKDLGLGGYVFKEYNNEILVIGVAKTSFSGNQETIVEVYRGKSKNPLYVSAKGVCKEQAAIKIKNMHGDYRMPTILKELDRLTKEEQQVVNH